MLSAINKFKSFSNNLKKLIYRVGGRERKRREGGNTSMCERNIDWLPFVHVLTRNQACSPVIYCDWESNL